MALVAGPLSPEYPAVPFPATVVTKVVEAFNIRTALLSESAMNTLPWGSTKTPRAPRPVLVAALPSPAYDVDP